jgi:hypothetical protein
MSSQNPFSNFFGRSKQSINSDRAKRSSQAWERGKKAPKKGNPRYKPVIVTDKNGKKRKVYKIRNPNKQDRKRRK